MFYRGSPSSRRPLLLEQTAPRPPPAALQPCSRDPKKSVLERIMPSDFLTPFLELDEEFCKVSRPRSGVRSGSWEGFR